MSTVNKDILIARKYVRTQTHELVFNPDRGIWFIAVDGLVQDARRSSSLTLAEAQEWYDNAGYQIGDRPA